jgi:nucleoside-diphosphate-sugar epimerase
MLNVLQAARKNGVDRVVYSSSSSVYGDQSTHVMREDMVSLPKSPYALHKSIGEQYSSMFARLFDMRVVSLRYFNVYGPRQTTEGAYVLVIPHFLRLRDEGKPLTVYGDGNQTRGYTHVSDVVRANVLAATADLPSGDNFILNIGPSEETSVNDIAAIVGGETEYVSPNPRGEFEELRKSADNSKAAATIGWRPLIPLSEGIQSVL